MAGIYLHIPFCHNKCIYCGFYSIAHSRQMNTYLQTLHEEIELRKEYLHEAPIRTLYFGGGTPSLLSISQLESILNHLDKIFDLTQIEEITLEANPEQLSLSYARQLRQLGINRLSIGVQSFQDPVLQFMDRQHSADDAHAAIQHALDAGFQNLSIDLIFGISERNDPQWEQDLQIALSYPIQHLSCYALTSEENSILYRQIKNHKHAPIDEEQAERQYKLLVQHLKSTPFEHYEVSNFALPGFIAKHNAAYWDHTPYLGLGPAAHSFNGSSRQWNAANLTRYISHIRQGKTCEEQEQLSQLDLFNECILLGLRTRQGVDLVTLQEQFGSALTQQALYSILKRMPAQHYRLEKNHLILTDTGLWFADGIAAEGFVTKEE